MSATDTLAPQPGLFLPPPPPRMPFFCGGSTSERASMTPGAQSSCVGAFPSKSRCLPSQAMCEGCVALRVLLRGWGSDACLHPPGAPCPRYTP